MKGDLSLLDKYHKNLLYGGGFTFSLLLIVVMTLLSLMELGAFLEEKKSDFNHKKTQVTAVIESRQMMLLRSIIAAETLWKFQHQPRSSPRIWAEEWQGRVAPLVLRGEPSEAFSDNAYYRDILNELAYLANSSFIGQEDAALSSYVFSTNDEFIGALLPGGILMTDRQTVLHAIDEQISLLRGNGSRLDHLLALRRPVWLDPLDSPLTGIKSFRVFASALQDGMPFISIVSDFPISYLGAVLSEKNGSGSYFMVNSSRMVILGSPVSLHTDEDGLMNFEDFPEVMNVFQSFLKRNYDCLYKDGRFYFSSDISNSGMALVQDFSWRDIFDSLKNQLFVYWFSAIFVIFVLWVFFIYFNKKIFSPIYRKSQYVVESESLSRTLVATAPYGLGIFSMSECRVIFENNLMNDYRGKMVVSEQGVGKSLADFFYETYAKHNNSENNLINCDVGIVVGGNIVELSISLIISYYQGARVLLCGFSNIASHKQIERDLEKARQSAEELNRVKSYFLAAMSHEIRTPLSAILGNLEILRRSRLSSEQKKRLRTILLSSNSLLNFLSDILDFSRMESGGMAIEKKEFDLKKLLRHVADVYEPLAKESGLDFILDIDESVGEKYFGDAVRIRQILNNLLSNAVKFTEKGHVKVDVRENSDGLSIRVTDTGIGIHASQHELIFDAFKQAHQGIAQQFGGSGLGLALCKKLAQLMGGNISLDSASSKGSTFHLNLPDHSVSFNSPEKNAAGLADLHKRIRVLVVDDHPVNRMLLVDQISILGCTVDSAENGEAALRAVDTGDFDIVFTDLQMRVMDGYAFSAQLKQKKNHIPVIAITAHASEDDKKRCHENGISEILLKPASLGDIEETILANVELKDRPQIILSENAQSAVHDFNLILASSAFQSMAKIKQLYARKENILIFQEIHSMKGSFAMANHLEMVQALAELEEALRLDDAAWFDTCIKHLDRIVGGVR